MNVTIRGKRWRLLIEKLHASWNGWGFCDPPTTKAKAIRIDNRITGRHRLEILIHEMLHAAAFELREELVAEFAEDCARILTKLGYTNESGAKDGNSSRDR